MKRFLMMGAALALVVGSSGCVDLNEKLVSQLGNSYVGTGPGLTAAVNAVYMRLRGYYGTEPQQVLNDMGTDEFSNGDQVVGGGAQGWEFYNSYNSAFTSADGRLSGVWNNEYIMIALANTVLDDGSKAPVGSDLTQATKDIRLAEARFLRAMAYFDLVRQWGPVTLNMHSISVTGQLSTEATRAPEDSIYAAILSDLDAAVAGLPVTQSDFGRATKGAALFLRSKVYLTRAYRPWNTANKQSDFQKSLADIKQILPAPMGSGVGSYSLVADPLSLWCGTPAVNGDATAAAVKDPNGRNYCNLLAGYSKKNSEIVFSVQFSYTTTNYLAAWCGNNTNCANYDHLVYLLQYDGNTNVGVGMTRDVNNGRPFRRTRPLPYMFKLFDQTRWAGAPGQSDIMDTRFDASFQTLYFANTANGNGNSDKTGGVWKGQVCPNCSSQAPVAVGDTAIFEPGYAVSSDFRVAHKYSIFEPCPQQNADPAVDCGKDNIAKKIYGWQFAPSNKKWQDNGRVNGVSDQAGGKDVIVMRLGEAYLIAAEADVQLGNLQEAADMINVLRVRAACGGPPKCSVSHKNDPAMLVTTASFTQNNNQPLDFVMDERVRELEGEGQRWADLVRPGADYFVARLKRTNPDARPNVQTFHALRPIPNGQIQAVTGTPYPQNPGWF